MKRINFHGVNCKDVHYPMNEPNMVHVESSG